MLDLGCDDGLFTERLAHQMECKNPVGVEIVEERAKLARARGVEVLSFDLDRPWPIQNESFDVVHANQVIEHVGGIDHFMAESFRVLRPGGLLLVSTENGSSWHNIFAAIMGWQIFSLTNVSSKVTGIGNPLALHQGEVGNYASWTHKTIFNYRGLKDLFFIYGLKEVVVCGSGYYPLPAKLGQFDPRHAHFLAVSGLKPIPII